MTTTRAYFARRLCPPPKFARSAMPSYVRTARRAHKRQWLRNVPDDRGVVVVVMTHGTASANARSGAGNGAAPMRAKTDGGRRRRSGGMMRAMTTTTTAAVALALRDGRGATRRGDCPGASDTALARLQTRRGRGRRGGGADDDAL